MHKTQVIAIKIYTFFIPRLFSFFQSSVLTHNKRLPLKPVHQFPAQEVRFRRQPDFHFAHVRVEVVENFVQVP